MSSNLIRSGEWRCGHRSGLEKKVFLGTPSPCDPLFTRSRHDRTKDHLYTSIYVKGVHVYLLAPPFWYDSPSTTARLGRYTLQRFSYQSSWFPTSDLPVPFPVSQKFELIGFDDRLDDETPRNNFCSLRIALSSRPATGRARRVDDWRDIYGRSYGVLNNIARHHCSRYVSTESKLCSAVNPARWYVRTQ